jgi:hypothetical protein
VRGLNNEEREMKKRYLNPGQLLPFALGLFIFSSPAFLHLPSLNHVEYGRTLAGSKLIPEEDKKEEDKKEEDKKEEDKKEEDKKEEDKKEEPISLKSYHEKMLEYRKEMKEYHCKVEKTYSTLLSGMQSLLESQMQVTEMMNQFNLMSLMMSMQMRYDQSFFHNRSNIIGNPLDDIFKADAEDTQHIINNYYYYQTGTGEVPMSQNNTNEGARSPAIEPNITSWNNPFDQSSFGAGIYGVNLDGLPGITPQLDGFSIDESNRKLN